MPAIPVSIIDSKECSAHLYSDSLELGGKLDVWSLKSKLTGLPKSIEASLRTTIFGNSIPLVSGGIESRGLETIIRRLVGPYGLLKDIVNSRATLYDLLKPLSGQHLGLMAEKIREFIGRVSSPVYTFAPSPRHRGYVIDGLFSFVCSCVGRMPGTAADKFYKVSR